MSKPIYKKFSKTIFHCQMFPKLKATVSSTLVGQQWQLGKRWGKFYTLENGGKLQLPQQQQQQQKGRTKREKRAEN